MNDATGTNGQSKADQRQLLEKQLHAATDALVILERDQIRHDNAVEVARGALRVARDVQFKNMSDRSHVKFRIVELTNLLAALDD